MRQLTDLEILQAEQRLFNSTVKNITDELSTLVCAKNAKYGNSALNPLNIFSGKAKVGTRIDDKLARVRNSVELRKNDVVDIMGYLTLICVENGWNDFTDTYE
jgi:hypothetical protein